MLRSLAHMLLLACYSVAEDTLARIWSEVCGLERVGVNDNFVGLGGHSLKATHVEVRGRRVRS